MFCSSMGIIGYQAVPVRSGFPAEGDAAAAKAAEAAFKAVLAEIEGEQVNVEEEEALLAKLGQLDLLLTWLWRVHGIDYYGGRELLLEAEYMDRAHMSRTIRGQRPEEGEEQDEAEGEQQPLQSCSCVGLQQ